MKKLLLLGGSAQQIVAIETAKRLGYYTVLCDFLPDNPGQYVADRFYLVSTTDKNAVLRVAIAEDIDGILAYASDPAAPTAAFVAEKLNLPTNPLQSVETLCNKDLFRRFLLQHGFNAPVSVGYSSAEQAKLGISKFKFPIIVKPVDSSGSKGVTVLRGPELLDEAISSAFSFSRSHRIIVEEYIEKAHPYLIGGDIFIKDGKVVLWGLLNCHRDNSVNPLVPAGKSYPPQLESKSLQNVKETLQRIVDALGIQFGAMNVELIVDTLGEVWPIDIGPRNGGNMIPDLLGMIFNVDIVEMTVQAAMGETHHCLIREGAGYYATHNLHSARNGCFKEIRIDQNLKDKILRTCIYKKPGDKVEFFDNAAKAIGIIFMHFGSNEEMLQHLNRITDEITIVLD